MLNPSRLIQFSRDYFCVVDPDPDYFCVMDPDPVDPDLFGRLDPVKWIRLKTGSGPLWPIGSGLKLDPDPKDPERFCLLDPVKNLIRI